MLLLIGLAVSYIGLNFLVRWIYPRQLFPYRGSSYESLPGLITVKSGDGNEVAFIVQPSTESGASVLFYLHGNGEDIGTNADRFAWFNDQGYTVIALDYPGYGLTTGTPTGESVRTATLAVWEYARDEMQVAAEDTVVWGRSLGGAPATFLATQEKFRGLVLESTFRSVFAVANLPVPLLIAEPFPTESIIAEVPCPIFLFHGALDRTIPASHSQKLAEEAGDSAELFLFPEGEHNNLRFVGENEMIQVLNTLRRRDATSEVKQPH
ncbi:alpha/beta fold hydrolase [Puniceicoccus vermicola]|uniref:Alpha/beta fold hydrolase n=1 Tax=Puniceicoccus vermicola TaxID=388746 RepID=A0A7X1E4N4_9BACT|nr:alpha/beta fold hydrolase [Puniceicoccus vermicola]